MRTQTSIEIRLIKQQSSHKWPQLHSSGSVPITPQIEDSVDNYHDVAMVDQQQFDVSIKKIKFDFFETDKKFTLHIYIKEVSDCQIHFSETNFTATFHTKYTYEYVLNLII